MGEPRNYEGPQAEAVDAQLSSAAPPQPPPTSSQAPPPLKMMDPDLCPKQQGEAYTAGYTKMKEMDQERMSVPIKRYLAQNVMPTVESCQTP